MRLGGVIPHPPSRSYYKGYNNTLYFLLSPTIEYELLVLPSSLPQLTIPMMDIKIHHSNPLKPQLSSRIFRRNGDIVEEAMARGRVDTSRTGMVPGGPQQAEGGLGPVVDTEYPLHGPPSTVLGGTEGALGEEGVLT